MKSMKNNPKVLYIEAKKRNLYVELNKEEIQKLPKAIFLAYTIQYQDIAESIRKQLASNGISVKKFQQVLGCSKIFADLPILFIGSSKFHATNLFLQSDNLFILENNQIFKISENEINILKAKRKSAFINFLNSNKLGILVTTKFGQENLKEAIKIRGLLNKKSKKAYVFISDLIDVNQFENFDIGSWINTACPGLALDNSKIINLSELPKN
jgi:2-(3-amino-3-carboxypropyl)histidine synthase